MRNIKHINIEIHHLNHINIAEVLSEELIIQRAEDGLDLLGDLYYYDSTHVILYEKNITPAFFDLKNGMAGEILQKFSTYRIRLAIVGDFTKYTGKSIAAFIYESNKGKHINFVSSMQEALKVLSAA